jgi:hypothetical protein
MLIRRHSTKKVSARFPREMPACAKRARFYSRLTKRQNTRAYILDSGADIAKHASRAQDAVPLRQQSQPQMQQQEKGARLNKAAATKTTVTTKPTRLIFEW